MIRLGLRLTVAGGREAFTRLALIAIAVAIGTGLLLTTLAGLNAVNTQNTRYAWLETAYSGSNAPAHGKARPGDADPLWWRLRADYYRGQVIGRIDLAATGPASPVPPGITALPGPGRYYASPALARLLRTTPAGQLADRYPGTLAGTIGPAALPAPNSLIIVIGRRAGDLSGDGSADLVDRISTTPPQSCTGDCALGVGYDSNGITLILTVVAAALLFPVLIFIGGATRLSATRREQRFAAMRLVGATPGQISVISTVESAVAAVLGVATGFGLFYALRPVIASIPFTGAPFFAGDLALHLRDVLLVGLGIPVGAAVAARIALRRVTISPLGVTRRVTPRPPRAWRVVPLLAGLAELGYFAYVHDIGVRTRTSSGTEAIVFLVGVLLVMAGLVTGGPWLTMLISRLTARRANRPATLIAARRLADNPQAAFRAVSGLVLAVFVGTCALGIITAVLTAGGGTPHDDAATRGTVIAQLGPPGAAGGPVTVPTGTAHRLDAVSGFTGLLVIRSRTDPAPPAPAGPREPAGGVQDEAIQELVACSQLAAVPALGRCHPGAAVAAVEPDYGGGLAARASMADTTWPSVALSGPGLAQLPIDTVAVATNGSTAAIERVRGALSAGYPATFAPQTMHELRVGSTRDIAGYRQLAEVVILTSLPIAGCSLAVAVAGGLAERTRPFSLLRLAGAPLGMLRRVITLEAAAPLLVTALVSIGIGFLTAHLVLRAQLHETLLAPGPAYYLVVAAGLLASLAVVGSTLPLLERLTGPAVARND